MRIEFNLNATIFKLSEKFDRLFSHVFIFGNVLHESHGFLAVPVKMQYNFLYLH